MRRQAPATARNREPILEALRPHLPARGLVLEVASGSGEHTAYFAQALPDLGFQPSDPDPEARASIDAWCEDLPNVRPALILDAAAATWPAERADVIVCINMIHIAPWQAAIGLMRGAARVLSPNGTLFLYGPYFRAGVTTAPSNIAFDRELRARNSAWGLRDLDAVATLAAAHGFSSPRVIDMPANNLSLVFHATSWSPHRSA
jgi:SAM-dependent methyltransferase